MSSNGFQTIFNNAAAIIRAKLADRPGVDKFLASLEDRLPASDSDPRENRELFIEPWIEAQQLGVPLETAEQVVYWLHRFGVLRLWVRVRCPNVEEGEASTLLETDSPEDFDQIASKSCDYCGRHHDLTWDDCDELYAFNTSGHESSEDFDYSRLKSDYSFQALLPRRPLQENVAKTSHNISRTTNYKNVVLLALQTNSPPQCVPTARETWLSTWGGPLAIIALYLALITPVTRLCGQIIAVVVSAVVLFVVFLVIRGQVNAKLAPTAVQRTAMYLGFPISFSCVTAGATGLHFRAAASESERWWARVEFGETSGVLVVAGCVLFISVLIFVWRYDYGRGWLRSV